MKKERQNQIVDLVSLFGDFTCLFIRHDAFPFG
jgi:hypothetical protein